MLDAVGDGMTGSMPISRCSLNSMECRNIKENYSSIGGTFRLPSMEHP
jgi:hypothetical protein